MQESVVPAVAFTASPIALALFYSVSAAEAVEAESLCLYHITSFLLCLSFELRASKDGMRAVAAWACPFFCHSQHLLGAFCLEGE